MKKYLLIVLSFLLVQIAIAQDVIVKVNGEELKAKVLEITPFNIVFQAPDSVDGKHYNLLKSEVFMVRFANGTKEVFQENLQALEDSIAYDPEQMYRQGQQDARKYYKGNGAMWGSAASIFAVGLLGPIVIAAIKPRADANVVPSIVYLQSPDYVKGYEKQAHKRKVGKAAIGAGVGVGIIATVTVMLISVSGAL